MPYKTLEMNVVEALSLSSTLLISIMSFYYMRFEELTNQCIGKLDSYIIPIDNTALTCGAVRAQAWRTEVIVTIFLALGAWSAIV